MTYRELQQETSPRQREEYFKKNPEQVQGYKEYCKKSQELCNEIEKYDMFKNPTEYQQALHEYSSYIKEIGNKKLSNNTENTDDTDTDDNENIDGIQKLYNEFKTKYDNSSPEEKSKLAKSEEFNQLKQTIKENNISINELNSGYKEQNVENTKVDEGIDI